MFGAFAARATWAATGTQTLRTYLEKHPSLFAVWDSARTEEDGAVIHPGVDADFLASSPSLGSLSHSWISPVNERQPLRERTIGAAYFRRTRRVYSSAAAAEWAWLHDGTTYGKLVLPFRLTSRSGTSDLLCTFSPTGNGPGVAFQVMSDGRLLASVGNGSTVYTGQASAGTVQAGVDYSLVVSKSADFLLVYVFPRGGSGIVFGVSITEPSDDPPQHTLSIGSSVTISPSRAVVGWLPRAMFFVGTTLPSDSLLARAGEQDLSSLSTPLPVSLVWSVDRSDTTYEAGSARRIQTIQNSGSLGGTRTQSTAADRPWAVRFPSGLVDYFPGGSVSVVSSLDPVAFAPLHGDGLEASLFFRFRIDDLSSNQRIVRTMTADNSNIGIIIQVQTDGSVRVFVGNGSGTAYAIDTVSGPGQVQEGVDYTIAYIKTPTSMALYLEDMVTPLLSGALSSQSSDAPSETLTMGQADNRIHGWVSEVVMLGIDANQAQREIVAARLARHNFGSSISELIAGYAEDGLAHAYTPESLQVAGGDVTAWNDVVGSAHMSVTSGSPSLSDVDGLDAVRFTGIAQIQASAPGAVFTGTNTPFSVLQHGSLASGSSGRMWAALEGSQLRHAWVASSSHRIQRFDGVNNNLTSGTPFSSEHRTFAHVFHAAGDSRNERRVDGSSSTTPLTDVPTITANQFAIQAGSSDFRLTHTLLFNRALNIGELTQLREALLSEAT